MATSTPEVKEARTLDELLLPGTPPAVREAYATLAERSRSMSFGPLDEDVVVLDTETTGLSYKDCALIEICAARVSRGGEGARFHTFVNPGRPIPPEIKALTGIGRLTPGYLDECRARRRF